MNDWEGECHRCGRRSIAHTMSYFNTENICLACSEVERAHPEYAAAQQRELAAVAAGDNNFPGVGAPPDLRNLSAQRRRDDQAAGRE